MIQTNVSPVPGITFLPSQTEQRLPLPRLDIASFVGFAERGPLHLPVPIGDMDSYRSVFGGDIALARDVGGHTVYANLPSTVQSFFANGGRRCYVVRVAGERSQAARFRVPGLVTVDGTGSPRLAAVSASSPGAWGTQLQIAARQSVRALPPSAFRWLQSSEHGVTVEINTEALRLSGLPAVRAGDVLKVRLLDGSCWLAMTAADRPSAPPAATASSDTTGSRLRLQVKRVVQCRVPLAASPPVEVDAMARLDIDGSTPLATSGALLTNEAGWSMALEDVDIPRLTSGDVVRLFIRPGQADAMDFLARVVEVRAATHMASPPSAYYELVLGTLYQIMPAVLPSASPPPDESEPLPIQSIKLLRMDLMSRLGDLRVPLMADMAFNAPHPRFWGDAIFLGSSPLRRRRDGWQVGDRSGSPIGPQTNESADSATWFRWLTEDPYDIGIRLDETAGTRPAVLKGVDPAVALAALLAPVASGMALTWGRAWTSTERARIAGERLEIYLPLDMAELFDEADGAQFLPPETGRAGADDLDTFDADIFYDRRLRPPGAGGAGESHWTLMRTARDLRYVRNRRLRGMHSLLFVNEIGLVTIPDAAHHAWAPGDPAPVPEPPKPPGVEVERVCPPDFDFVACSRPPSIHAVEPHFGPLDAHTTVRVHGSGFASGPAPTLTFGPREATEVVILSDIELTARTPSGLRSEPVDVHIHNANGSNTLTDAFIYTRRSSAPLLPLVRPPAIVDQVQDAEYLAIQEALSILCHARGDLMGILSLPIDYRTDRCLAWQSALRNRLGLTDSGLDEPAEKADLSYIAVFHPWLLVSDNQSGDGVRALPPDGAICGLIAASERQRQVWIAPANLPLNSILGLESTLNDNDWASLFALGFNLVRHEANDFRLMSAHTLSRRFDLLQISVRRLLILIRKAVERQGLDFVFESNHEVFREGVRVLIEEFLRSLYERGAFAGRSESESFRVITDASVNTLESVEQGRFIAQIEVAPSQPTEFITVKLTRLGDGDLLLTET